MIALTESFWRRIEGSPYIRFGENYEIFVYKRGTKEQIPLWSAEEGGAEVTQPLKTDEGGRALGPNGEFVWADPGRYDIVAGGERVPWTDAEPGSSSRYRSWGRARDTLLTDTAKRSRPR